MKKIPLLIPWLFGALTGSLLFADVITLKDGRQISGAVESGTIRELHIKVGDQSQTIGIDQVQAIQFGSPAAPPLPKAAAAPAAGPAPAQPNSLVLKDGSHIVGKWWSIDATDMHFLVDNQLQHYPRGEVSAVTFGNATLPPPAARSAPAASPAQAAAGAAQPPRATAPPRSSADRPPESPKLPAPARSAPPSEPSRGLSQPEEIGMVYFWNGTGLIPLERNQAVEHKSGSTQYWEMAGPRSRVRLNENSTLVFVLRLSKGVDPASYSLIALATVNGNRRTQSQPGRQGGLVAWPVEIEINYASSLMTYALSVKDLPTGEYSFSPASSNDGFCFGVDPSAPGQ
jgi:hypothetical protein